MRSAMRTLEKRCEISTAERPALSSRKRWNTSYSARASSAAVGSSRISEHLGRPVVKAFNAVLAETLANGGTPSGTAHRIAIPVAADDAHAMAVARGLVDETGFDALDAGDLAHSWHQQPGTPAYCTELTLPELQVVLSAADKARAPVDRDVLIKGFMETKTPLSHKQIVARNREVTAAQG
jgi:hypothetical protein